MRYSECDGVRFYESANVDNVIDIKPVSCDLNGFHAQLKTLRDVKLALAKQVKKLGGDCLTDFKYCQEHHKWWQHLFHFFNDDISWKGTGIAGKLK